MASQRNGTLYTGVTTDLIARVFQHKNKVTKGFTRQYGCNDLYELCGTVENAILREKQLKGGSIIKKLRLIESIPIAN